jgi:ATP-dependent DNA ligase
VTGIAARRPAIGALRGKLPQAQAPQLCSLVAEPPEGNEWVSEVKFDGYRLLATVEDGKIPGSRPLSKRAVTTSCSSTCSIFSI